MSEQRTQPIGDPTPVVTDPTAGEPVDQVDEPATHTSALQGAAAGGMGANATGAGYAGGMFTGSETNTGMADIPDADEDADSGEILPGDGTAHARDDVADAEAEADAAG